MTIDPDDSAIRFQVVVNQHGQYSIWPAERPVPDGWRSVPVVGARAQCLAYIEDHWTDMRPKAAR
jgi:MbtH protein